ncbi:CynX/NimT family MFS transporter [Ammoniphilus resinae]|uniref:CP family cyanate transporter-like MFS transporter n=1 Tax=Ammoniphilus resinae TaxID=861532 RepID=A0ABS4GLB1_9BACL|nr:MFS transporter [Ammoniphilus resinae]MBP1931038.1 CP family cyanate transporter-like MFS transporter [Ammoniphilus resinae]
MAKVELQQQIPEQSRVSIILLVSGIILIASSLRAPITAVGPLVGAIVADTNLSNALVGLLTTLPLLAFAGLSLLAPKIAHRYGIESTLLMGLVILTLGIVIRSLDSMVALFLGTAILGLAIATGNVLLPSLIKRDFPYKIGLMTGIYTLCMNGWAAIASGVSIPLAEGTGLGWRAALMCWALLSAIAVIVFFPQTRFRHTVSIPTRSQTGRLWKSSLAWQVTLFMGLQSIGFFSMVSWLSEILHERGMDIAYAGWLLSFMQIVSLPASFIFPILAARFTNQRLLVVLIVLFLLIGYGGILSGGTSWLLLSITLMGFAQGAGISLALTMFGLRTSTHQQAAELSGMAQSIGYLLASTGPVLFGFLHDLTHSWTGSILILVFAAILQLITGLGAGRNVKIPVEDKAMGV